MNQLRSRWPVAIVARLAMATILLSAAPARSELEAELEQARARAWGPADVPSTFGAPLASVVEGDD